MARRAEAGVPLERRSGNGGGASYEDQLRGTDEHVFADVLRQAIGSLEEAAVPYALIGGIASSGFGRPRWTHDIDVFLKPEDAERALALLHDKGFETEVTDPTWLLKAFKEQVMVDIIFRAKGDFYFDDEMFRRSHLVEFQGTQVRLVAPEDLVVLKAVVHDEAGPRHWHDALGIIAQYQELDWDYLLCRARKAPRRVLSLLIYAHSLDLLVPNRTIDSLYSQLYHS